MKLSDQKFLTPIAQPNGHAKTALTNERKLALRSAISKLPRSATLTSDSEVPEYVSYIDPEDSIRRYGWLVSARDGLAKIEIADGAYTVVPEDVLERSAKVEDIESKRNSRREDLKAALGTAPKLSIRADLAFTREPVPLTSGDYSLTLQYDRLSGKPSDEEILRFVAAKYPRVRVIEADDRQPGKMSLIVHAEAPGLGAQMDKSQGGPDQVYQTPGLAAPEIATHNPQMPAGTGAGYGFVDDSNKTATEMPLAVGGEVQEILDPEEDVKPVKTGATFSAPKLMTQTDVEREKQRGQEEQERENKSKERRRKERMRGRPPQGPAKQSSLRLAQNTRRPVSEIVQVLLKGMNDPRANMPRMIEELMMNAAKGMAEQLKSGQESSQTKSVLAQAIRMAPSNRGLWQQVSSYLNKVINTTRPPAQAPGMTPAAPQGQPQGQGSVPAAPQGEADFGPRAQVAALMTKASLSKKERQDLQQHVIASKLTTQDVDGLYRKAALTQGEELVLDFVEKRQIQASLFNRNEGQDPPQGDKTKPWPPLHNQDKRESAPNAPRPSMKEIFARMHCGRIYSDGDSLCMRISWDTDLFRGVGSPGIKQAVLTYVKGMASQKDRHRDMGVLGSPRFQSFDVTAGVADIEVRSSEARSFPRSIVDSDADYDNFGA